MPGIAQDFRPHLVDGKRLAADMARDARIAPHGRAIGEVDRPMSAQSQPLSLDDRNDHDKICR